MLVSHLSGGHIGLEPQTAAEVQQSTDVPTTTASGEMLPSVVDPVTRILGLTPFQWLVLGGVAFGTYLALSSRRRK